MTIRIWAKRFLVLLGLACVTSSFGQDITLKKLYDGVEDIRFGEKHGENLLESPIDPYEAENSWINKQVGLAVGKACSYGSEVIGLDHQYLYVSEDFSGSFTQAAKKQTMYRMAHCELGEGLVITQGKTVVAAYNLNGHAYAMFAVRDINQNGLTEFMLLLQSKAKAPWNEMLAIQIFEFPNGKPVSLGSFFVGGPLSSYTDGGPPQYVSCSKKAPRELQKFFPSNIIYVQKGKNPQFFAEGYEINCDYREKGVKVRKVSGLTSIKPVPRAVPLARLF